MSQTKEGAKKAKATMLEKYGADFYAKIGASGGKKSTTGGFYYSMVNGLDTHIEAGCKGGKAKKK